MRVRRKVEKIITHLREININIEKRVTLHVNKLEDLDIIITNEETVPLRYNQKSIQKGSLYLRWLRKLEGKFFDAEKRI